jgi:hypothetical protein
VGGRSETGERILLPRPQHSPPPHSTPPTQHPPQLPTFSFIATATPLFTFETIFPPHILECINVSLFSLSNTDCFFKLVSAFDVSRIRTWKTYCLTWACMHSFVYACILSKCISVLNAVAKPARQVKSSLFCSIILHGKNKL